MPPKKSNTENAPEQPAPEQPAPEVPSEVSALPPAEAPAESASPEPVASPPASDPHEQLLAEIVQQTGMKHPGMAVLNVWSAPGGLSVQVALAPQQVNTHLVFLRLSREEAYRMGEAWHGWAEEQAYLSR